jgi:hypothetical protein
MEPLCLSCSERLVRRFVGAAEPGLPLYPEKAIPLDAAKQVC